jgi:membrane protease YdiL (CAAX protease family)
VTFPRRSISKPRAAAEIAGLFVLAGGALALALFSQAVASEWMDDRARAAGDEPVVAWRWASLAGIAAMFAVLAIAAVAIAAVLDRRRGLLGRIGFQRSALGPLGSGACALGTVFTTYLGAQTLRLFGEPSPRLRVFDELFAADAGGLALSIGLVAVLAVGPAFGEELLFRGVLLRGLLARLPRAAAIAIVAVGFAAVHADLQHAIGVAPTGFWLTIVAVRSRSLWPAISGHLVNNLVAGLLISFCGVRVDHQPAWVHLLAWTVTFPAFLLGTLRLHRVEASRG